MPTNLLAIGVAWVLHLAREDEDDEVGKAAAIAFGALLQGVKHGFRAPETGELPCPSRCCWFQVHGVTTV